MRTRAAARALACAALCLGLVTGCGGTTPTDTAGSSESQTTTTPTTGDPTASTSTPSTPSTPNTPATPSTSPTTASSAPAGTPPTAGLAGRLLSAEELPGFNADYLWTQGRTTPESPSASFGTCQRFSVISIGAERALVRRFRPAAGDAAPGDRAGELVAEFPDALTARRAFAVLEAWRARCADRLQGHTRPKVGALQDVAVPGGSGGWYLLTYGPVRKDPDAQFFDAQGMAVVGTRIAMVSMVLAGQDYDYEPGKEPAVTAVQRAAARLS